jgi:hypothetical protein
MTDAQRCVLIWGPFYQQLLRAQSVIPEKATIRWVSSQPPWYVVYYLYPRLLFYGALSLQELPSVRRRFPSEWVLSFVDQVPKHFEIYEPLQASKGPR